MTIFEAVRNRRSIRKYLSKEIPDAIIDKLKEALIWAPSAGNLQARKFYFIINNDLKKELAAAALKQNFISQAPLVIVACTDSNIKKHYGERGESLYSIQDVAASIMAAMLVAHEEGLGSVWVGAFHEHEAIKIIGLPGHLRPVAIVPIGYPSSIPKAPPRISVREAVTELS